MTLVAVHDIIKRETAGHRTLKVHLLLLPFSRSGGGAFNPLHFGALGDPSSTFRIQTRRKGFVAVAFIFVPIFKFLLNLLSVTALSARTDTRDDYDALPLLPPAALLRIITKNKNIKSRKNKRRRRRIERDEGGNKEKPGLQCVAIHAGDRQLAGSLAGPL